MPITETTEEYLARGGKLTRVSPGKSAHITHRDWHRAVRGHGFTKGMQEEAAEKDFARHSGMKAAYNMKARVDSF